jgi:hypothetical protein
MQHELDDDAWQIDPVTARVRPGAALGNPVIVVVEPAPSLSRAVAEICAFLQVGVVSVREPLHIADLLPEVLPIAVLHEAEGLDCDVYDLLMVIAGHDPNLPLLLVMTEGLRSRGAVEAAQRLWELTDVRIVPQRPGIRGLIDFLFHAGRKFGRTRFMPI